MLLDAAVFRMDEYMRVAPSDGFTRVDHITPSNLARSEVNNDSNDPAVQPTAVVSGGSGTQIKPNTPEVPSSSAVKTEPETGN